MKKFLSLVLCLLLICTALSACSKEKELSDLPEQSQEQSQEQPEAQPQKPSDGSSQKPLRVLFDTDGVLLVDYSRIYDDETMVESLLKPVAENGGPTDVEV